MSAILHVVKTRRVLTVFAVAAPLILVLALGFVFALGSLVSRDEWR